MGGFTLRTDNIVKKIAYNGEIELDNERLKQLQNIDFSIAKDVIECCERRGVSYTLSGGTCLGAIRHGGFIPWDDDMDLNISRSGFGDLLDELKKTYGDKYWLIYPGGGIATGYAQGFVQKAGTTVKTTANIDKGHWGVTIDLFIIENAPNNPVFRRIHGLACMVMGFCLSCRRYYELRDFFLSAMEDGSDAKKSVSAKVSIGKFLSFAKLASWVRWTDKVYSHCKDENSKYVVIPSGRRHYFKETYERTAFFPAKRANFNGMDWCIPNDASTYMEALYGSDYMTPPAPEERERHNVFEFDLGEFGDECEKEYKKEDAIQ